MGERGADSKRPDQRAPWGGRINGVLSPIGISAIEQALSAFTPHNSDDLDEDPATKLDVYKQAEPYINIVAADAIKKIEEMYCRDGVLVKSIFDIITAIDEGIIGKYPEHAIAGKRYGEAYIFGELKERIQSHFLTVIALKEDSHREYAPRKKLKQARRGKESVAPEDLTHSIFFQLTDHPEVLSNPAFASYRANLEVFVSQYQAIKLFWIPFLKKTKLSNPQEVSPEVLKGENDRVAQLLRENSAREVPLCTVQNTSLNGAGTPPLTMQFSPIDNPKLGVYQSLSVQVNYFEDQFGAKVAQDKALQDAFRTSSHRQANQAEQTRSFHAGKIPPVFLKRNTGELQGINIHEETLKMLAGKSANYELLRRDILWYLAQITCRRATLEKMFGKMFAKKNRKKLPGKQPGNPGPEDPDTTKELPEVASRNYPRSSAEEMSVAQKIEMASNFHDGVIIEEEPPVDDKPKDGFIAPEAVKTRVDQTLAEVARMVEVSGHTMLLTLIARKIDEETFEYESSKPSETAVALAARAGQPLRQGFEIPEIGLVIYPDELDVFINGLKRKGIPVNTLEDVIKFFEKKAYVRNETWVPRYSYVKGEETPENPPLDRAVSAETRRRTDAALSN